MRDSRDNESAETAKPESGGASRRTLLGAAGALGLLLGAEAFSRPPSASAAVPFALANPYTGWGLERGFAAHVADGSNGPGLDYKLPAGTQVRAPGAGNFVFTYGNGEGGWIATITHPGGWRSQLLHLSGPNGSNRAVGLGEIVGVSGGRVGAPGAGNSEGPHLHWSLINPSGVWVDPLPQVNTPYSPAATGAAPLKQVYSTNAGATWQSAALGLTFDPQLISAVNVGGTWPQLMMVQGNALYQVYGTSTGWTFGGTGVAMPASSMSAVYMGGNWPQVFSVEGGILYQTVGTTSGWRKQSTGLSINGQISATRVSGSWPTIMLAQGGLLYQINGTPSGWKVASTGIPISGQISAVHVGGAWPQVMAIENGYLYQIWADGSGWHKASTGLNLIGSISAVNAGGGWPTVMLDQGGAIYRVWANSSGWHVQPTNQPGTGRMSAVYMSGGVPQVIKVG